RCGMAWLVDPMPHALAELPRDEGADDALLCTGCGDGRDWLVRRPAGIDATVAAAVVVVLRDEGDGSSMFHAARHHSAQRFVRIQRARLLTLALAVAGLHQRRDDNRVLVL